MRKISAFPALAASLGFLLSPGAAAASQDPTPAQKLRPTSSKPGVLVIAHRGCWGEAPEMSLASIQACVGTGVDGVEIDIRKTKDGALILIHDETVDRTTDGKGVVAEMTLAEIRALRLRKGQGGPNIVVTDERVPTLEEGLSATKGKFIVHLDYKTASLDEIAVVLKKLGMEGQATGWLKGLPDAPTLPNPSVADTIALVPIIMECAPGTEPCRSAPPEALNAYARHRPAGYFLNFRAPRDFLRKVAAADRPAGTWISTETLGPVDSKPRALRHADWQSIIDIGVTMILTDQPADLLSFLKRTKVR